MTTLQEKDAVAEWHEWRRGGIGGSDIAGLLLPGEWSSPWKVWAEKVGLLAPSESTARQRIGQRMEPVLADLFREATGLNVVGAQTRAEHARYSWARCTVDGLATETAGDGETGSHLAVVEWKTDGRFGWPEGPPANYRAQAIWNMAVTGVYNAFIGVMFAGFRFELFKVPWDDSAQQDWALMFSVAEPFWNDHVLTGVPPEIDGSDATAHALSAVYPDHTPGVEVELDGLAELLVERGALKDAIANRKKRLDEIDNTIRAAFGDAEVGTFGGLPVLTYRSSQRAGYTVEPTTVRTLRAASRKKEKKQ